MVLLPRSQVKVCVRCDEASDGPPGQAEVECAGGEDHAEGRIEGVAAVVEELAEL